MKNEGPQLLRLMLPFLAGRITLAQFTGVSLALGVLPLPPPDPKDLVHVLQEENFNVSAAARRLRVCTKTIYRRLQKSGKDIVEIRASGPS